MQNNIIVCVRGWLGTRFHHQGRLKKTATHSGGVDCLGLLLGVADELGLRTKMGEKFGRFDQTNYSHSPDTAHLKHMLDLLLTPVDLEHMSAGDIVLLSVDNSPQHLGIIGNAGDGLSLIHAYAPARAVVEHALDALWRGRIEGVYRVTQSS